MQRGEQFHILKAEASFKCVFSNMDTEVWWSANICLVLRAFKALRVLNAAGNRIKD